jgi:hypothetical protein
VPLPTRTATANHAEHNLSNESLWG